jgi:hypothetical protein
VLWYQTWDKRQQSSINSTKHHGILNDQWQKHTSLSEQNNSCQLQVNINSFKLVTNLLFLTSCNSFSNNKKRTFWSKNLKFIYIQLSPCKHTPCFKKVLKKNKQKKRISEVCPWNHIQKPQYKENPPARIYILWNASKNRNCYFLCNKSPLLKRLCITKHDAFDKKINNYYFITDNSISSKPIGSKLTWMDIDPN